MRNSIYTLMSKDSSIVEAYKKIRTNLLFMNLDNDVKSIVITSANPEEGKSTTAYNLATVLAQAGSKTILVDADLRKPTLHKIFCVPNEPGLTNLLMDNLDFKDIVQEVTLSKTATLKVITSGTIRSNPSELLGSEAMFQVMHKLEKSSDIIIFDTPPALAVTDASLISGMADGVLLVTKSGKTSLESLKMTIDLLKSVKSSILGIVLNRVSQKNSKKYYNYLNC